MWPQYTSICVSVGELKVLRAWTLPDVALLLSLQLSFAAMHISSHRALEYIPPLVYGAIRIGSALPLLALSARLQVPVLSSPPTSLSLPTEPACTTSAFLSLSGWHLSVMNFIAALWLVV